METAGSMFLSDHSNETELPASGQLKDIGNIAETTHIPAQLNADSGYHSWSNIQITSPISQESDERTSDIDSTGLCITMPMPSVGDTRVEQSTTKKDVMCTSECLHSSLYEQYLITGKSVDESTLMDKEIRFTCQPHDFKNIHLEHKLGLAENEHDNKLNCFNHFDSSGDRFDLTIPNPTMSEKNLHIKNICTTSTTCIDTKSTISDDENRLQRFGNHVPHSLEMTAMQSRHTDEQPANLLILNENALQHSKDKIKLETQDLAAKIEFCLMFGYTVPQIRLAITKLSYKATKNDILMELSNSSMHTSSSLQNFLPIVDQKNAVNPQLQDSDGKFSELVGKGLHASSIPMLIKCKGHANLPLAETVKNKANISESREDDSENLRPIVIDGSNVAMSHGNKQCFSCKGILLTVDYFQNRNHRDITVFVPTYRKESTRPDSPIKNREILDMLEQERILVFTPSRYINGKRVTCYDDRFILKLAQETDGIIVSNDNFRDLQNEKPEWKELIEKRLLMYSFVSDRFMPPDDPLGRNGPSLDNFLRKRPASEEQNKPECPYGKKCTYGKKCKYFHPECSRSVTDRLKEKSDKRYRISNVAETLATELVHDEVNGDIAFTNKVFSQEVQSLQHHSFYGQSVTSAMPVNQQRLRGAVSASSKNISFSDETQCNKYLQSTHPTTNTYPYQTLTDNLSENFKHAVTLSNREVIPDHHINYSSNPSLSKEQLQIRSGHDQPMYQLPYNGFYAEAGAPADFHLANPSPNHTRQYRASSQSTAHRFESGVSGQRMPTRSPLNSMKNYQHVYDHNPGYMVSHAANYTRHANGPHFTPLQQHSFSHPMLYPYPGQPLPNMMSPSLYVYSQSSQGSNNSTSYSTSSAADRSSISVPRYKNGSLSHSDSDPKTYPPCYTRRLYSVPSQPMSSNNTSVSSNAGVSCEQEYPFNNPGNSRYHLFQNLCGLFKREIVLKVMKSYPDVMEPKVIIQMCLSESD